MTGIAVSHGRSYTKFLIGGDNIAAAEECGFRCLRPAVVSMGGPMVECDEAGASGGSEVVDSFED